MPGTVVKQCAVWTGLLVALAIAVFQCHLYVQRPLQLSDLERGGTIVAYAEQQNFSGALLQAASHDYDFLNQAILFVLIKSGSVTQPVAMRYIDSIAVILAVFWLFRIGRLCLNSVTGMAAALVLACMPPAFWGPFALFICIVLLNWEVFLYAVKYNSLFYWAMWCAANLLLFSNRVFAEPIVLQSWFLVLLATLLVRKYIPQDSPRHVPSTATVHHHHHHRSYGSEQMQKESIGNLLLVSAVCIWFVAFFIGIICAAFFLSIPLTAISISAIFLLSLLLVPVFVALLLLLPMFSAPRSALRHNLVDTIRHALFAKPRVMFTPVHNKEILNVCFTYSTAIMLFIPFLFFIRKSVNVFIDYNEFSRWILFMRSSDSPAAWVAAVLPLVYAGLTAYAAISHRLPRSRFVGALCLLLLSSLYLFQQRYAVFSAPFHLLCSVAVFTTLGELFVSRPAKPVHTPAPQAL